ncbi:hypothetical protein C3941_19540 [Kaistia algarum]|uniref:hypothetical protein n=1 Tax=Kaistia algarum TaxID=2083279 RepID=UPI000CE8C280|nr:hypothetical protein [Kaistia algarum]MCX5516186.1 hypothetical protein [Kaistia algarum]PPE78260.1 hypothetical protein C3941_19540 [Kaistia algarum]
MSDAPASEIEITAAPTKDGTVTVTIGDAELVLTRADALRFADLVAWAAGNSFHRPRREVR